MANNSNMNFSKKSPKTAWTYPQIQSIQACSNFSVPESSFFQCISVTFIETIIRYSKSESLGVVNNLLRFFNTQAEVASQISQAYLKSDQIAVFQNILKQLTDTSNTIQTRMGWLTFYAETSDDKYNSAKLAFDYGMRCFICALFKESPEKIQKIFTSNFQDIADQVFDEVAKAARVKFVLILQNEKKEYVSSDPGNYPIIYLMFHSNNYLIVYTKEMDDLLTANEPNAAILESPVMLYKKEAAPVYSGGNSLGNAFPEAPIARNPLGDTIGVSSQLRPSSGPGGLPPANLPPSGPTGLVHSGPANLLPPRTANLPPSGPPNLPPSGPAGLLYSGPTNLLPVGTGIQQPGIYPKPPNTANPLNPNNPGPEPSKLAFPPTGKLPGVGIQEPDGNQLNPEPKLPINPNDPKIFNPNGGNFQPINPNNPNPIGVGPNNLPMPPRSNLPGPRPDGPQNPKNPVLPNNPEIPGPNNLPGPYKAVFPGPPTFLLPNPVINPEGPNDLDHEKYHAKPPERLPFNPGDFKNRPNPEPVNPYRIPDEVTELLNAFKDVFVQRKIIDQKINSIIEKFNPALKNQVPHLVEILSIKPAEEPKLQPPVFRPPPPKHEDPPIPRKMNLIKCEGPCNKDLDPEVFDNFKCPDECKICPKCRATNLNSCIKCQRDYSAFQKEDIQMIAMTMN